MGAQRCLGGPRPVALDFPNRRLAETSRIPRVPLPPPRPPPRRLSFADLSTRTTQCGATPPRCRALPQCVRGRPLIYPQL